MRPEFHHSDFSLERATREKNEKMRETRDRRALVAPFLCFFSFFGPSALTGTTKKKSAKEEDNLFCSLLLRYHPPPTGHTERRNATKERRRRCHSRRRW
jgi:hypothetical protein